MTEAVSNPASTPASNRVPLVHVLAVHKIQYSPTKIGQNQAQTPAPPYITEVKNVQDMYIKITEFIKRYMVAIQAMKNNYMQEATSKQDMTIKDYDTVIKAFDNLLRDLSDLAEVLSKEISDIHQYAADLKHEEILFNTCKQELEHIKTKLNTPQPGTRESAHLGLIDKSAALARGVAVQKCVQRQHKRFNKLKSDIHKKMIVFQVLSSSLSYSTILTYTGKYKLKRSTISIERDINNLISLAQINKDVTRERLVTNQIEQLKQMPTHSIEPLLIGSDFEKFLLNAPVIKTEPGQELPSDIATLMKLVGANTVNRAVNTDDTIDVASGSNEPTPAQQSQNVEPVPGTSQQSQVSRAESSKRPAENRSNEPAQDKLPRLPDATTAESMED